MEKIKWFIDSSLEMWESRDGDGSREEGKAEREKLEAIWFRGMVAVSLREPHGSSTATARDTALG